MAHEPTPFSGTAARANNKPSEQTSKASILKTHLLPAFDRVPLDRIGVQDVERLKATLLERVSRKRVNNVLNVLSKILKYAHELEVVEKVPRIKTLKVAPTKFDFFTYEELDQLVDAAKDLRVTGWHVLRHTFCSHLAMKGAPPRAIQELAGHQSITVTNRYMHLAPGELRNAIALLDRGRSSGQRVANRTEK